MIIRSHMVASVRGTCLEYVRQAGLVDIVQVLEVGLHSHRIHSAYSARNRLAKLTPTAERLTGHKTGFRKESDDNPKPYGGSTRGWPPQP
jgi:hypothetical protein